MSLTISTIKIGDNVKVKNGVKAPDFNDQLMDGWQGKVTEIQKEYGIIEIEWDTKTLLETPYQYLHDIIRNGYDYELMNLLITDVELTEKRDILKKEELELKAKLYWIDFYDAQEKNKKYGKLFQGVDISDRYELYAQWEDYLSTNLKFPFEVEVKESERGGLRIGTKIKLLDIDDYDEMYGNFGIGKYEMGAITTPICNLEATDKKSENYELLKDYVIWFANM